MPHSFPGYRVLQRLYASPRSIVERAIRVLDGRAVVIKQPQDEVVTADAARRIQHECEILRVLRGDGIIDVVEIARDGSHLALVLESFGESLLTEMVAHRFSLGDALDVASEVARILTRVHAAGVVHKDLNPTNILYDAASRTAKLVDFDIASRTSSASLELVAPAALEGTLLYMAPEQTGRLNRSVDARSDLYSLGMTLHELFTGQPAFAGDDALAIVHAQLAQQPARIDTLDPAIPAVVAEIVIKLVAKAPEQRYQTATGLLADLERCRRALADTGQIERFALGTHDISSQFAFPERLYGRDPEIRALVDAFTRTSAGGVETVLVSGYSGIGKSSVVRELYAPVTARRGLVGAGKFEQLQHDVPYGGVVAALEELLAQIIADPALARWRAELAAAVGDDGALVRAVLPAIERVLGPQPAPALDRTAPSGGAAGRGHAPVLDPETAQRRLAAAMSRVIQVFARKAHPLVLFLDDMQWADAASLQLLTRLATSEDTESLLLVEAYRDNEVDAAHPFAAALRDHDKSGAKLSRIALGPLALAETEELVADALRVSPDAAGAAAAVVWRKTSGNPFFIRHFMQTLHDEGYLAFDPATNAFAFDLVAIEQAAITDNVAELVARNLDKLPGATRDALVIASAIGSRFELATLAIVAGCSETTLHAALAPAVDAGMIVPIGALAGIAREVVEHPRYRFQHDRIQQTAYEASPPSARERLHLEIGRQLLASSSVEELDARLFDVVHHLQRGLALITDETELVRFAALASAAARRARRSGALEVATALLESVCASRDGRAHDRAWFEAHVELAGVMSLAGRNLEARALVRVASEHAGPRDLATLEALDAELCMRLALLVEALACARRASARLGVELPSDPAALAAQITAETETLMAAVARRPVERWIELPALDDPDCEALMALFASCIGAAYQVEPQLMVLLGAKLLTLSLRHGTCGASAHGYTVFAVVLWMKGEYDACFRFGQAGADLVNRIGASPAGPAVEFAHAAFSSPWRRPLADSVARLRAAVPRAIEAGDLTHAGLAAMVDIAYRELLGAPLAELVEQARGYHKLCTRLGLAMVAGLMRWYVWHARSWTAAPPGSDEAAFDPAATEQALIASQNGQLLVMFRMLELEQRFWRGDFAGALEASAAIAPQLASIPANVCGAQYRYYHCLAAIAVGDTSAPFEDYRADLGCYAEACPANFGHMSALVEAELARTRGRAGDAMVSYEAAIDGAAEHGFLKVETIAHELAAQFWLERRKPGFAAVHLGKARDLCQHWGARPRAHALERQRRGLGAPAGNHATFPSMTAVGNTLDFAAVVKASHAIASDIVLSSLLAKIMEIIIENTGAQTGSIILASGGELFVHASKQVGAAVAVTDGRPLAMAHEMSEGIISYVTRTSEVVVLGDATRHPTFRTDPYVRDRRPRSVLCLPIVHKERMIGAVYLENNLVVDAFTVERLDALGILISQLAISIENAMMFSRLEEVVAQRTAALTAANQQLREQALVRDRMESELRLAQKLQSVGQLAAGVAHEINTPVQYIGDSVGFLQEGVASLIELVDVYRASTDPAAGTLDLATVREAEDRCEFAYVRKTAPEACVRALQGIDRVAKIVRAMKLFSHPDCAQTEPAALNAALENTLIVAQSEYRNVAEIETDLGDLPDVMCHAGELNQVFLNLIVNAAHAIEDVVGRTGERGKISITTRRDDDHVVIAIRDTGGGIPEAIRDRVFDPFFTTKVVGRGSGQGLALARAAIVERHGGTIEFETVLGVGTTFVIRIPVLGRANVALAS